MFVCYPYIDTTNRKLYKVEFSILIIQNSYHFIMMAIVDKIRWQKQEKMYG